ncbi:hypothetical protein WJX84_004837 [Apatococcus fuscideae]|uniref:Glutathione S-transferase n=1 Tax=Apatococcus fuscideae TaxID=2026836 RepID=A0AAW1SSJ3_9CHLO
MTSSKPYTLYTSGTPNGWKVTILLEELGVGYNLHPVSIFKGEQKEEWFRKINPNARIPALVDHDAGDTRVFESGAIMWYLATKHLKYFPQGLKEQAETMSWLMWQMGGLGPMQGQAAHFLRFAKEKIPYGISRYQNETDRLYQVLDTLLEGKEWLSNNEYSIADMATFPWVYAAAIAGISMDDKPNLQKWVDRCMARPATSKGLDVPEPNPMKTSVGDPEAFQKRIADVQKISIGTDKK